MAAGIAATYAASLANAGHAEAEELNALVERHSAARNEEIRAMPEGAAAEALENREVARAFRASMSVLRLDPGPDPRDGARIDAHVSAGESPRSAMPGGERVPGRRLEAPLDLLFHLLPGWDDLPGEERERWRAAEHAAPGGRLVFELAWIACDGARDLDQIFALIVTETGTAAGRQESLAASVAEFFTLAVRLGIAEWKAP
jgi:hypothetical protein